VTPQIAFATLRRDVRRRGWLAPGSIIKTLFTGLYNGAANIRGPVPGVLELLACSRSPVKPARNCVVSNKIIPLLYAGRLAH